jgi:hypothetical protein
MVSPGRHARDAVRAFGGRLLAELGKVVAKVTEGIQEPLRPSLDLRYEEVGVSTDGPRQRKFV